jgi:hypothetical protein
VNHRLFEAWNLVLKNYRSEFKKLQLLIHRRRLPPFFAVNNSSAKTLCLLILLGVNRC